MWKKESESVGNLLRNLVSVEPFNLQDRYYFQTMSSPLTGTAFIGFHQENNAALQIILSHLRSTIAPKEVREPCLQLIAIFAFCATSLKAF